MKYLLIIFFSFNLYAQDAGNIIKKADSIRNPMKSFYMQVEVESSDAPFSKFEVFTKGKTKTLIKTLLPKKDRGRNLLMLDEQMWIFIPNLRRSVRVALSQKLTGQTSNGDISRMNWSSDYNSSIVDQDKNQWKIFLKSNKKGLTYDQLYVWIEKNTFRPIKAEYLSLSGKPLKLATFSGYKLIAGKARPTVIKIENALNKTSFSTMNIIKMEIRKIPNRYFNKQNLK